jgi:hypothetical protein
MKVFLSWSGERSKAVAKALREWLPYINSEIEPWMSDTDIGPGERWSGEIARELEATKFGIVCVTRDNQAEPWLNFEAGAIAKQVAEGRAVPLTIDLKPSDVKQPLGGLTAVEMTKDGMLRLLRLLNELCEHQVPDVAKACSRNWSALESAIEAARTAAQTAPVRAERDLIEEILAVVRGLAAQSRVADAPSLEQLVVAQPVAREPPSDAKHALGISDLLPPFATATIAETTAGQRVVQIASLVVLPKATIDDLTTRLKEKGFLVMVD